MRMRIAIFAVLLLSGLGAGTWAVTAQNNPEDKRTPEIVTMKNMRTLVPSLVALSWDDFFLGWAPVIEPSQKQAGQLAHLAVEFVAARRELQQRLEEAELTLYDELDRDQVSLMEVAQRIRWVGSLRGESVVLRYGFLLQAINVLNHEQHLKLVSLLKLQTMPEAPPTTYRQYREMKSHQEDQSLKGALQNVQFPRYGGSPPWPGGQWPQEKESWNNPCSSQSIVSVNAFVGYDDGRDAAKKLMKLADKLSKLSGSDRAAGIPEAREWVDQMQREFQEVEKSSRALWALLRRNPTEEIYALEEPLDTELMSETLIKLEQQLNDSIPDWATLAREAKQLRELVKGWEKAVKKAGNLLCLR